MVIDYFLNSKTSNVVISLYCIKIFNRFVRHFVYILLWYSSMIIIIIWKTFYKFKQVYIFFGNVANVSKVCLTRCINGCWSEWETARNPKMEVKNITNINPYKKITFLFYPKVTKRHFVFTFLLFCYQMPTNQTRIKTFLCIRC